MNPFHSLIRVIGYFLTGRLHFPKERLAEVLTLPTGQQYSIFRQVVVDPDPKQPKRPEALFRVQFHLENMTPQQNKFFSIIPIPFFVGLPGFRSKLWTSDEETGDFQGIYEWDTMQDAKNYANSFAMKFMTRRSRPGSVRFEISRNL